jgi:hypothetical protein
VLFSAAILKIPAGLRGTVFTLYIYSNPAPIPVRPRLNQSHRITGWAVRRFCMHYIAWWVRLGRALACSPSHSGPSGAVACAPLLCGLYGMVHWHDLPGLEDLARTGGVGLCSLQPTCYTSVQRLGWLRGEKRVK